MGGGDLNMKKSWHPLLLSNQQRVWEVEKKAHEEKKRMDQLRKELEEERQLAELQRLQEESTGKKRTERLDWMYATPSTGDGGALGGARLGEKDMEDYLLGKKRVDEVLRQGDENIGASSKDFIAVQNANTAQDLAAKIREDPLLAIKQQEQQALQAMMMNPTMRRKLKEMKERKEGKGGESKDERKERKRREKEDRKLAKKESKQRHHQSSHHHSQSYHSDSDNLIPDRDVQDRQQQRGGRGGRDDDEDEYHSGYLNGTSTSRRYEGVERMRSRSPDRIPRRYSGDRSRSPDVGERRRYGERPSRRDDERISRRDEERSWRRDEGRISRGDEERSSRSDGRDRTRSSWEYSQSRKESSPHRPPPPQRRTNGGPTPTTTMKRSNVDGDGDGDSNGGVTRIPELKKVNRPTASEMMDRPTPPPTSKINNPSSTDESTRSTRLAQMANDAINLSTTRLSILTQRQKEEEAQLAIEEKARLRLGKTDVKGSYVREQERIAFGGGGAGGGAGMGLADVLARRGGRGLEKE